MFLSRMSDMYYSPFDLRFRFYIKKSLFRLRWDENFHEKLTLRKTVSYASQFLFCFVCMFGKENSAESQSEEKMLVQDIIIGVGTDKTTMLVWWGSRTLKISRSLFRYGSYELRMREVNSALTLCEFE